MQNLQVQPPIDFKSFIGQLKIDELENARREISARIRRLKTNDKNLKIGRLIQKINETALSEQHWTQYFGLAEKLENETITEKELLQYEELVREERVLQLKRIKLMGEIAQLKGISLMEVTQQLGIKPREYA